MELEKETGFVDWDDWLILEEEDEKYPILAHQEGKSR
jgi:hypothetical protein